MDKHMVGGTVFHKVKHHLCLFYFVCFFRLKIFSCEWQYTLCNILCYHCFDELIKEGPLAYDLETVIQ